MKNQLLQLNIINIQDKQQKSVITKCDQKILQTMSYVYFNC